MTDVAAVPIGIHTTLTAAAPTVPAQVFGSGLIGLREGLEAGIVVMVLIAFLVKSERRDALKWVWLGVGAAVVMTVGVFLAIQYGTYTVKDLAAEAIAGVASLVAVAIVTSMVLWMRKASASMSGELRAGMSRALETGALAVFMLAFLAVGPRGRRDGAVHGRLRRSRDRLAAAGPAVGVLVAAAHRLGHVRRRSADQPGQVLQVHRRVPDRGRRRASWPTASAPCRRSAGCPAWRASAFDISSWFNWSSWYGEIIQGVFNITPDPDSAAARSAGWPTSSIVLALFLRPTGAEAASGRRNPPTRQPRNSPAPPSPKGRPRDIHRRHQDRYRGTRRDPGRCLPGRLHGQGNQVGRLRRQGAVAEITVDATDTACALSGTEAGTGPTHVRDHQQRHQGHRVLRLRRGRAGDGRGGEHLPRPAAQARSSSSAEPGTYKTACKPGMVGDGIRADFIVTGDAVAGRHTRASSRKPPTATSATSTARPTP